MKLSDILVDLLSEAVDPSTLDVDTINPDKKDVERAEGLQFRGRTFKGDSSPWASEASKMAKLIKDPVKLVRRAKAVAQMYGSHKPANYSGFYEPAKANEIWKPFQDALDKMGFSNEQISKIHGYKEK